MYIYIYMYTYTHIYIIIYMCIYIYIYISTCLALNLTRTSFLLRWGQKGRDARGHSNLSPRTPHIHICCMCDVCTCIRAYCVRVHVYTRILCIRVYACTCGSVESVEVWKCGSVYACTRVACACTCARVFMRAYERTTARLPSLSNASKGNGIGAMDSKNQTQVLRTMPSREKQGF